MDSKTRQSISLLAHYLDMGQSLNDLCCEICDELEYRGRDIDNITTREVMQILKKRRNKKKGVEN